MAIKVYICEDEKEQREVVEKAVNSYILFSDSLMTLDYSTDSATDLSLHIDWKNELNVYFLDIDLKEEKNIKNGLELAQEIRKKDPIGYIIFITVHSELAFLTFQYMVGALDFIVKAQNVDISRRVRDCLKTVEERLGSMSNLVEQGIRLNTSYGYVHFLHTDILYFSTNKTHVITLHATDGKEYQVYQKNLSILEEDLKDAFIRCHRSFLVNSQAIFSISKNYSSLVMRNGAQLPIATRKKSELKKMYKEEKK